MKILTSAQFDNYSNRKDKSVTLRFITGEKTPEQIAEMHTMLNEYGYLYFKAEETLTDTEIAELDDLDTDLYENPKTQAQRIRGVLYRNWQQDDLGHKEFKAYYKYQTEKIIQHYKDKLDN